MIAINVVKSTYANEHLITSFPAEWRCTVNSYKSANNTLTQNKLYRQFPNMSITFDNFWKIIFLRLYSL